MTLPARERPTPEALDARGKDYLPGLLGLHILGIGEGRVDSRLEIRKALLAPNGYLHAASVIALADTSCGYGCVASLPEGASGFTTMELKSNFFGSALEGAILCTASAVHLGRSTQVWDATVTTEGEGRRIALFRCTQMVLWPKPAA